MAGQQRETKNIVKRAVRGALADIEKYAPDEFKQMQADATIKTAVIKAVTNAAEEYLKLEAEFNTEPSERIGERLQKHLPPNRVNMIETGLKVPTYAIDINKKEDGHHWADITRNGKMFMASRKLDTTEAVQGTSWIQMASILVEAVLLVLQCVGIKVAVSEQVIERTAQEVVVVVENSSQLQRAIKALQEAAQGGSKWEIAKAIFNLIKDSYSASILWKIIKSLCSNMSTWDWIKTAGIVSAMIIAALTTDGAALIAKIVLALNSAYEFIKKLTNLSTLDTLM